MAAAIRRPNWVLRQAKGHPTWFVTVVVCLAALILEVAATTSIFGLANHHSSPSRPSGPNLNPYDETILAIQANVTYKGAVNGYFPALNGQAICTGWCPRLPVENYSYSPPQDGILFFYNLTNTGNLSHNLSLPVVSADGPIHFEVQVMCCYAGLGGAYSEWVMGALPISPSVRIGFEAYAWTTDSFPFTSAGGYTLYANFTST